jgi:TRAP-type C4-dicarboxylate transport system substrate-binding protein
MVSKLTRVVLLSALSAFMAAPSPAAESQLTLKFAHVFPATHKQWVQGGEYFGNLLDEASGGRIKLQQYPAGQLGKESTSIIGSGLAETGIIAPSYEPDKLPLSSVAELPGISGSACEGSAKLWDLVKDGGIVDKAELAPLGLHALYAEAAPQYSLLTTKREVTRLEDMKGLKIRANGAAMDKTARILGAVPVSVTASEFFDALTRGTVDGGFWSLESIRPWGLQKLVNYAFDGVKMGTAVTIHVMNKKVWEDLDHATKVMITKAAMETQQHFCSWYDAQVLSEAKALSESGDVKIDRPSPDDSRRWDRVLASVAESWATELDSSGRPGSEVLKAFRQAPANF